jgi:hypothetical protein
VCNNGECRPIDPRGLQDVQNPCNLIRGLTIMSFCSCLVSRTRAISGFGSLGRVGYASETGSRAIRWRGLASIATDKQQKVWAQQSSLLLLLLELQMLSRSPSCSLHDLKRRIQRCMRFYRRYRRMLIPEGSELAHAEHLF